MSKKLRKLPDAITPYTGAALPPLPYTQLDRAPRPGQLVPRRNKPGPAKRTRTERWHTDAGDDGPSFYDHDDRSWSDRVTSAEAAWAARRRRS